MVLFGCKLLFLFLSLLVNSDCQEDIVTFLTNAGEGRYRISYNETSTGTVMVAPPPPGFFSFRCLVNGQPSTTISYAKTDNTDGTFEVDSSTGALSLQEGRTLDYETTTSYQFGVRCSIPSGEDDIAQVDFDVLPVNEFEPVVSPRTLTVLAFELDPIGRVLASTVLDDLGGSRGGLFSATDGDAGPDGRLMYSLDFNENSTSFSVDSITGTLRIAQQLDVDDTSGGLFIEQIRLTVCDINPPVNTCPNLVLTIIVFSANDNNPVFSQDVYRVTLMENATLGSLVTTVSCTDADVGAGVFKNVTSTSNLLNITLGPESSEQTLSLDRQLDYEMSRSHDITLMCYDTGGLNATASLIITVEPVNDNPPKFSTTAYFFTMNRAETTGNEIGRVVATDADEVLGGDITYTLSGSDDFQIQGDGTIILADFVYVIDGETFTLTAVVSDGEFSDTASVTITVNGVLSVPEIILVCMGALIFLVLVIFIIIGCCYCCVCCSRLIPKQRHVDVEREVIIPNPNTDAIDMGPMAMPMSLMGGSMFNQGKGGPIMIGQVPMMGGWGSQSMEEEEEESEEEEHEMGSIATASSRVYSPTPYLKEMLDIFKDGDEVLEGKKSKKSKSKN